MERNTIVYSQYGVEAIKTACVSVLGPGIQQQVSRGNEALPGAVVLSLTIVPRMPTDRANMKPLSQSLSPNSQGI